MWVEANDDRNAPLRVYAPEKVRVDHAATWPVTWTPPITVTAQYYGLDVAWAGLEHPDVDAYVVYYDDQPLVPPYHGPDVGRLEALSTSVN